MTARLDYRWHLRQVMASRGMFATTDLIEPVPASGQDKKKARAAGGEAGIGGLRPRRARITRPDD